MKVALDISPLENGHSKRGIGSYTASLKEALEKSKSKVQIVNYEKSSNAKADLVHYPYFDLFFHTLPIKKDIKRLVTIHDIIPLVFPEHFPSGIKGKLNLFLQKAALKNTDLVLCDSKSSKNDIVNILSYPEEKIRVVYLAPDKEFKKLESKNTKKVSTKYKLPENFVLYVGDVNWNKNIKGLLEAIKISKTSLVMVGTAMENQNIPEVIEINRLIDSLGIGGNVIITGFIPKDDLVALYNLAAVTLAPSFYEGFGFPVLESMACGTPVVCSNNSSLSEISGGLTTYCNPRDPADIANKIREVISLEKKNRTALEEKLISHAKEFTWEKVADQTIEAYESLLSS